MAKPTQIPTDKLLDEHARLLKCNLAYAIAWEQVQHYPEPVRFVALALRWHSIADALRAVIVELGKDE